jgi:putative spermidine/putrescine transport system substrate-binding protein
MIQRRLFGVAASAALIIAACGGTGGSPSASPGPSMATSLGTNETALSVLAWPGYVEDGSTYPEYDWVTGFEKETGCDVTVQIFGTSDEAYTLYTTSPEQYDVVSASGDASLRLVLGGFVQPVNLALFKNYPDIFDALKNKPYNTVGGVAYGIPHGRGSNLLMWRTDEVTPAPTSWAQMFDPANGYKVSIYDAPVYIADAAVVLMATRPELGIKNPYALDETQFQAAVDLLKQQKPAVTQRWVDYLKQMDDFRSGNSTVGTTWQVITNLLQVEDPPVLVEVIKPSEGATGWSDTWMVNSKTKNLACSYAFIDHLTSPVVNASIADYFGEAPGNSKSCELTPEEFTPTVSGSATMADHCAVFHANDDAFWKDVWYWQTPGVACVDGRTDVKCKGFDDWVKAWTEIKG